MGLQTSAWVSVGKQIGDEVTVRVEAAHPRDDILSLKEVVWGNQTLSCGENAAQVF